MSTRKKNTLDRVERASDLLSDLQGEVEQAAAAEAAQLEAVRRARIEAEAAALQREAEQRRVEIEARLESEARRQALRAEAMAPTPEPVAPEPERAAPAPSWPTEVAAPLEPTPPASRMGFYAVAIGLPLLCVSAVVGALVYQQHRDRPQPVVLQTPTLAAPLMVRTSAEVVPNIEFSAELAVALPEVTPVAHRAKPRKPRATKPKARPKPAADKPFKLVIDIENDK